MSLRLITTVALLLVALCHVAAEPAWADKPLPKSTTVPVVEQAQAQAQLHRENLAPGNGVMGPRNYNDESVAAAEEEPAWANNPLPKSTTVPVVEQAQVHNGVMGPRNYNDDESGLADGIIRANVIEDSFDLVGSTKETYMAFMSDLDYHVNSTGARWLNHHPVLAEQQLRDAPPTWFNLTVVGRNDDMVCFFMRSDNLYISGFTNKNGQLISFKPDGGQYRMPGSSVLKFGSGYPDLLGRNMGYLGLLDVKINKELALTHLNTLANFQDTSRTEELVKVPAAFFVLIIAEAERFAPLRDAVFRRWEEDTPRSIDDTLPYPLPNPPYPPYQKNYLINLVVSWRTFSCAILSWDRHGQTYGSWRGNDEAKEMRTFGVQTAQDAFRVINPILQPSEWRCTWTPLV
ncbi:unnamed protein product [Urochloa humidicola]